MRPGCGGSCETYKMSDKYRIIDEFELSNTVRETTDVIEVFRGEKIYLYLKNTPRPICGPATIVADIDKLEETCIYTRCLRQLVLLPPSRLLWDGRARAANEGFRRGLKRAFLTRSLPHFPALPPKNAEGTYSLYTRGGFIPLVPKAWRIIPIDQHRVEWVVLAANDKRIVDDMFEEN